MPTKYETVNIEELGIERKVIITGSGAKVLCSLYTTYTYTLLEDVSGANLYTILLYTEKDPKDIYPLGCYSAEDLNDVIIDVFHFLNNKNEIVYLMP